jgi:hypothetical protein
MAKYLRGIQITGTSECAQALSAPSIRHLNWMFERYATPCRSGGVAKIIVTLTTGPSGEIRLLDEEGIAGIAEHFAPQNFLALPEREQQEEFLCRIHAALIRCTNQPGWDRAPLDAARDRIMAENFATGFFWKKPVASPDRRWKAQAFIQAGVHTFIDLVFFNRELAEQRRVRFSAIPTSAGAAEFVLGRMNWLDNQTVRILHQNNRDYWTCGVDGSLAFHFPNAEDGNPQGLFQLGRLYDEGLYVLPDRERGLELIQQAAAAGYRHARRFMEARARDQSAGPKPVHIP